MSTRVKSEQKPLVSNPLEEGLDSPSPLTQKWKELVNIILSPVEQNSEAQNEKAKAVEKYRNDLKELLVSVVYERVPQQPVKFDDISEVQSELFELLKSKEGKKFESLVRAVINKHVAYEQFQQASFNEALEIVGQISVNVTKEDRENSAEEIQSLHHIVKQQEFKLKYTTEDLNESAQSLDKATKSLASRKNELKKLSKLQGKVTSLKREYVQLEKEFVKLRNLHKAEKEGHTANIKAYKSETTNLIEQLDQLNKDFDNQQKQLNRLLDEKKALIRTANDLAQEKESLKRRLQESEQALAAQILDTSNVSEDITDNIETIAGRVLRQPISREMVDSIETAGTGDGTSPRRSTQVQQEGFLSI